MTYKPKLRDTQFGVYHYLIVNCYTEYMVQRVPCITIDN